MPSFPGCEGPCARGFFCPEASTTPYAAPCGGPAKVCPTGSAEPIGVPDGYYSVHSGPDADERAARDPRGETRDAMLPCEPGHYCVAGTKRPCDDFRFGWRYLQSDPKCDGAIAAGCYAPLRDEPYLSDCPNECGAPDRYCPATGRERRPTLVSPGYYTVGGTPTTRTGQAPCPPAKFCSGGAIHDCPAGKWQPDSGMDRCSRDCPAGFMCPAGATEPVRCPESTFSLGLATECTPCPAAGARLPGSTQRCFDDRICCEAY